MRVEGILDVNTVEHRIPGHPSGRGFLPITSLCSHSCVSNTFKSHVEDNVSTTRAKVHIPRGEQITHHYSGGLKGRIIRLDVLHRGWYFWCR